MMVVVVGGGPDVIQGTYGTEKRQDREEKGIKHRTVDDACGRHSIYHLTTF